MPKKATLFLPEAAKACFEAFLAELEVDKAATIDPWEKMPVTVRERWARVAVKTYDAMIGEGTGN